MPPKRVVFSMTKQFDLFANLKKNLNDFETESVEIAKGEGHSGKYLGRNQSGYIFSQKDTVNAIDLAMSSTFKSGLYDAEGQRKVYLNGVRFIRDVSRMRTDIDVKHYVFKPDNFDSFWKAYFMQRQFRVYARENNYGEVLNRLGDDYATYGTAVTKRVGKEVHRVPIRNLKNTQTADSLNKAAKTGGYVIEEHKMTKTQIENEMPGWDVSGLEYDKEYCIYEQHCLVPRGVINRVNERGDTEDEKRVLAMQILVLEGSESKKEDGKVLFIEEEKDTPYEEAHWEKVDGRWLGRGPVENELENQIARNMAVNMRRRSLLWSSKKLFQSASEDTPKNLVKDVKDGQVLYVGTNGTINPIAMETRSVGEYQSFEDTLNKNSQQTSFTFEVATGESMPSGTPFRLGVILSNAVDSFFQLKQEQFGLFLKRAFFTQMIPIFKRQTKEHTISVFAGEEGVEHLKQTLIDYWTDKNLMDALFDMKVPDVAAVRSTVEERFGKTPYYFIDIPDSFYDDVEMSVELEITDESSDTKADVETLTTLYQTMVQAQDPRAERVLQAILGSTGRNLDAIAGKKPAPQPMQGMPQLPNQQQLTTPQQNAITA